MTRRLFVLSSVAIAALAFGVGQAWSQEKKSGQGGPSAEEIAMAQPGPHHKHFADMVGEWEVTGKAWFDPSSPGQEFKGTSKFRLVHGGRFLVEETESNMGGGMTGTGIFGYDNVKKKHVNTWCDSMATGIMLSEGTCEGEGCKKVTEVGTYAGEGGDWTWRGVAVHVSPDKMTYEATMVMPAGLKLPEGAPREHKAMEITYTRKKK